MPILLSDYRNKLRSRLNFLDSAFERHIVNPAVKFRVDRYALQEGLVSSLWQAWSVFCRETLIGSTVGALNAAGDAVTSPYSGISEMEAAHIARQLSQRSPIRSIKPLRAKRLEPTWGDAQKINLIASGISSSNSQILLTAFGSAQAIADLQLCRNASAHLNDETRRLVLTARVRYNLTKFKHPSDMVFWIDPLTNDFAWKSWIDEIDLVSSYAVL